MALAKKDFLSPFPFPGCVQSPQKGESAPRRVKRDNAKAREKGQPGVCVPGGRDAGLEAEGPATPNCSGTVK